MFRRKASLFGIVCAAVVLCLSAPAAAQTKAEILRKLAFFDAEARTFYFLDENGLVRDAVPVDIASGTGELKPVAGDWDGDGLDSVGVYNCRTQTFYLTGKGAVPPVQFVGGRESCWPLAGDWDGDGRDGIALYDQKKGAFYVKNDLSRGSADLVFKVENAPAWVEPLSGHWTLLPNDGVGFRNPDSALMVLFSEAKQGSSSVFFGLRFTGQLLSSDFNSDARDEIGAFKARGAQGQVTVYDAFARHRPSTEIAFTLPRDYPYAVVAGDFSVPKRRRASVHNPPGPQLCLAYDVVWGLFGGVGHWDNITLGACAPGHAAMACDDGHEEPFHSISCCPLPAADILRSEYSYESTTCPPDFVFTGRQVAFNAPFDKWYFRCTKINTNRYQLGPEMPGIYFGEGYSGLLRAGVRTIRSRMPTALRYGIQRIAYNAWEADGCIGFPFGSLLVNRPSPSCDKMRFRELQYRGAPGDPPAGSPVTMYPQCSGISDIFGGDARCLP